jgi:hypothetical protein
MAALMPPEALDRIVDRLERAAALVDECARLAAEAGAELDREVRSADVGPPAPGPAGQLALDQ